MRDKVSRLRGQVVSRQPRSMVAEAFRTFRTTIHFSPRGGQTKVIMVTSPASGDGKSTVASNLAIAIAQGGKRTILIDADCRNPDQHRIFGAASQRGLSTFLGDDAFADGRAVLPAVPTDIDHLDLMPAGPEPANPSELLSSQRFVNLIARLRERYDQIIIDSPPTLPVSDSRIISTFVDGYVLVLRAGKSGRKTARYATELLASVGATPLGLVINGVTRTRGNYGYNPSGYVAHRHDPDTQAKEGGRPGGLSEKLAPEPVRELTPKLAPDPAPAHEPASNPAPKLASEIEPEQLDAA